MAGRDRVAHVQDHVARLLVERHVPVGRRCGRNLHAVVAPVGAREVLVVRRTPVESEVLNVSRRELQPVTRVRVGHRAHGKIPYARLKFRLHPAVERDEISIFGGAAGQRALEHGSGDPVARVGRRWDLGHAQIKIRIAADAFQLHVQQTHVIRRHHRRVIMIAPQLQINSMIIRQGHAVGVHSAVAEVRRRQSRRGGWLAQAGHLPGRTLEREGTARQRVSRRIGPAHFDVPGAIGQNRRGDDGGVGREGDSRKAIARQGVLAHAQARLAGGLRQVQFPADDSRPVGIDVGRHDDLVISALFVEQQTGPDVAQAVGIEFGRKIQLRRRHRSHPQRVGRVRINRAQRPGFDGQRENAIGGVGDGEDVRIDVNRGGAAIVAVGIFRIRDAAGVGQGRVGEHNHDRIAGGIFQAHLNGWHGGRNGKLINPALAAFERVGDHEIRHSNRAEVVHRHVADAADHEGAAAGADASGGSGVDALADHRQIIRPREDVR